ncbi:MAG TPA: HD-GYP domain-containing protein [Trueperaceae bacterium]
MPENLSTLLKIHQKPRGGGLALAIALIAVLLGLTTLVVYSSGGTSQAYLHLAYLPIILAGFLFHRSGGLLAGIAAGLLLGPLMPLDVGTGVAQEPFSWLFRLLVFALVGVLTGQLARLLAIRTANLAQNFADTLHSFAALVATRDEQVAGHCERVARNATVVGRKLGLDEAQLDALHWAGVLHDLGKVAIPDRILLKSGPLSEEEYELVKTHCTVGADLVGRAGGDFELVASGIRTHHERWDGTGYPAGLEAEAIPLFGRILGVVDVFEALTSERPYRKSVGVAAASELLRRESGGHFDPAVVRAFLELSEEGRIEVADTDAGELNVEITADENH